MLPLAIQYEHEGQIVQFYESLRVSHEGQGMREDREY